VDGDFTQLVDYTIGSPAFKNLFVTKPFKKTYQQLSNYKRKKLLSEVKRGIKSSDGELTDLTKVHESTIQLVKASLKRSENDVAIATKDIIANIICPNSDKTFKVK
jgi:hypothetical protein